ncbi:trans-sulfuration enzyme family protein [Paenibacillus sp. GCM10027628]|uniref:trans-sulfuration enzyme family protein n=1 Tax=Paenibacillus sp. GCM10027628 TaxID=3273413 RepID=UPI003628F451
MIQTPEQKGWVHMSSKENRELQFTMTADDPYDARHYGAITIPIYQNSLFAFEHYDDFDKAMSEVLAHHVYSRGNNPTVEFLEHKLAELEGGEAAKCFASGMAAITASILSFVKHGDHIICVHQAYGPTREFLGSYLERFGIETTFIDGSRIENWEAALRPDTKLFYLESPTTMQFELQDLQAVARLARSNGAATVIDGTWATPCFQKPLELGVDLVVHSITKYISGHSDCLGGVVIGAGTLVDRLSQNEYMLFGGIMTPQTAALVIRGLRTLPLRMQRHESSGLKVALHLQTQPYVARVNHPGLGTHPQHELARTQMSGFGSLFSFESQEPLAKLREWASRLRYFRIGVSWGGFESLVTVNPIEPGGPNESSRQIVRLYIGMENPDDLIQDIDASWRSVNQV